MSPTRRDFLKIGAALGISASLPTQTREGAGHPAPDPLPVDVTEYMMMTLYYLGNPNGSRERGSVGGFSWSAERGWVVRCNPAGFSPWRLKDRDDRFGVLCANDYPTPAAFMDAIVRAAFQEKPDLVRVEPAHDHHDYTKDDWLYDKGDRAPRFFPDSDSDTYIAMLDGWWEIIDTRAVIQERHPWATVVIKPNHVGYELSRFYARIEQRDTAA